MEVVSDVERRMNTSLIRRNMQSLRNSMSLDLLDWACCMYCTEEQMKRDGVRPFLQGFCVQQHILELVTWMSAGAIYTVKHWFPPSGTITSILRFRDTCVEIIATKCTSKNREKLFCELLAVYNVNCCKKRVKTNYSDTLCWSLHIKLCCFSLI